MFISSLAIASETLTKHQVVHRSADICRALLEEIAPHVERADDAMKKGQLDRFIRESRDAVHLARPYANDLEDLRPARAGRRYRRFVDQGEVALDWLDLALDALEAKRVRLARHRNETALDHLARAKRAARRYGLRRACIRVVS